tara:strand:- start:684 stop:1646 length:963 start_codon:yes stop_codon:yes gene_type:complete
MISLVKKLASDLPDDTYFAYPTPGPLYRKLSKYLGISPDHILLTRGSDGAIKTVYEAYIEPGDTVLVSRPTYQMYSIYAQIFGARMAFVDYEVRKGRPYVAGSDIIANIRSEKPKLVGLPFPDNPVGFALPTEELKAVIEAAGDCGALILIDEAYHPFHDASAIEWVKDYGHLVIARTFSKAWGMAGIRLGYTVAQPSIIEMLNKVRTMIEADGVAMALAERMLDHEGTMLASVARLRAAQGWFVDQMLQLGFYAFDTPCNFVHVDFGAKRSAVEKALKNVVRFRVFPDALLKPYMRFTTTTKSRFQPVVDIARNIAESG